MNYKIKVEIAVYKNDDNMTDIISVTRRAETTSVTDAETAGVAIDNAVRNILTDLRGTSTVVLTSSGSGSAKTLGGSQEPKHHDVAKFLPSKEEVLNSLDASLAVKIPPTQ